MQLEDEGGIKRLNESGWRSTLSEYHQLYRQTWAKQFTLAQHSRKNEHQANGEHIPNLQIQTELILAKSTTDLLPLHQMLIPGFRGPPK